MHHVSCVSSDPGAPDLGLGGDGVRGKVGLLWQLALRPGVLAPQQLLDPRGTESLLHRGT